MLLSHEPHKESRLRRTVLSCPASFLFLFLFALASVGVGCTTVNKVGRGEGARAKGSSVSHAPKASPKVEPVCLSRDEVGRLLAFKVRCRAKVKELRLELSHKDKKTKVEKGTQKKIAKERRKGCLRKTKATLQSCPSCVKPAIVSGLVGVALVVVAWVTVEVYRGVAGAGSKP